MLVLLLQAFLKNSITYPDVGKLIMILISSFSNTSPIERSYSILEMICSKRRSALSPELLETLYLLGNLKIDSSTFEYEKKIELMETDYVFIVFILSVALEMH